MSMANWIKKSFLIDEQVPVFLFIQSDSHLYEFQNISQNMASHGHTLNFLETGSEEATDVNLKLK